MSEEKLEQKTIDEKMSTAKESPVHDVTIIDEDATVVQSLDNLSSAKKAPGDSKEKKSPKAAAQAKQFVAATGNSLCAAASILLSIAAELRRPHTNIDLAKLRKSLTVEINAFNLKAKNNGIEESHITLARYVLCAVLDEFVLDTPWGANSNWSEYSLLNTFHQDSSGGAKFFAILEKMQQSPAINLDMLELLYTCLSLGYLGKYRITSGGKEQLASIKTTLYRQIESQRGETDLSFTVGPALLDPKKVNKIKRVPVLRLVIIVVASLIVIFLGFKIIINSKTNTTVEKLRSVVIDNTVNTDGQRIAK
jgi:type VI secretion system protein ImpK